MRRPYAGAHDASGSGGLHSPAVAPPKRKSGGRVTPSGTRPGEAGPTASGPATPKRTSGGTTSGSARVGESSRYTPPVPKSVKESPPWVPVLMLGLLVVGGVVIMLRYLVFTDSNWPTVVGLVCILGGLYTATKWR